MLLDKNLKTKSQSTTSSFIVSGMASHVEPTAQADSLIQTSEMQSFFVQLVVIDSRTLERECFVACLRQSSQTVSVEGFTAINDWQTDSQFSNQRSVILYISGQDSLQSDTVKAAVRATVEQAHPVSVIIIGAEDDIQEAIIALDCGAAGYIPASIQVADIIEAARITLTGAWILSRDMIMSMQLDHATSDLKSDVIHTFTVRQLAVAQALRHGTANKAIAFDLDLKESTVKVHIRHIFHKLKVTNRTAAAYKLNSAMR